MELLGTRRWGLRHRLTMRLEDAVCRALLFDNQERRSAGSEAEMSFLRRGGIGRLIPQALSQAPLQMRPSRENGGWLEAQYV